MGAFAPTRIPSGKEEWSYTLTSYVQPGDRVLHWDKRARSRPAIVGWSEAVGPLELTGLGKVQLTQGEVDHARRHQPTDLFVVDSITAERVVDAVVRQQVESSAFG